MISVFFVLVTTIAAINIFNYAYIEKESKSTLTEIIEFDAFGLDSPGFKLEAKPDNLPPEGEPPDARKTHENSFFICVYESDGTLKKFNYNHIFALTEDECKDLSLQVYNGELKGRKYDSFRFAKVTKDDGCTYVAFIDIKIELNEANKFLLISSLISVGAYAVLTVFIVVGSKIAFKPNEEAYKKQKKFITNASHELKTPLTVISADLDLIEMDNGKSEWSDSIRCQVDRLTKMTKQLVDLSRLEEDDSTNYPFEDFSLNDVCKKAIDSFEPAFKKENIKFFYTIQEDISMFGSRYLIDDLIYIFLDNSVKYTGGKNKESVFKVSKSSKGKVELFFSNSLDAKDEVDVNQIMERFYRSPSNKKDGSGVGLSIAQEIINLHKGKIKISKIDNVISFVVTID